jgi:Ricin-type beta-trefoil lectin domain
VQSGEQIFDIDIFNNQFRLAADPNLCLDVPNANAADGQAMELFWCHGGPNQQFDIYYDEIYSFLNVNKCLDVTYGVGFFNVILMECTGGAGQDWDFIYREL